jgi:hypothetical protein
MHHCKHRAAIQNPADSAAATRGWIAALRSQ